MRIVFIGGRDLKNLGGIENYMLNLASQLVRLGHEPIVFCESDHDGEEQINGFRVIHQKGFKSNLICKPWLGLKATIRVIKDFRDADLIHYNAWPPSMWSPLARLFGIRSLMQGHGLEWQRSKYSGMQQRIMRLMEWYTAHLNLNLIMCSDDQTRYFKEHYGRTAVTIPTAINLPDSALGNQSDILKRFGIRPKRYFLFLARLVQDKNPNYLIRAFEKASAGDFQLVIAGNNTANPEYVKHLHALAAKCKNIIFTDAVYGDDKDMLLREAYAFCLPSTIEGLSISLLEAMSYRLPIIASDISANREVLEQDKALWCKPEDEEELKQAIEKAINDESFIQSTVDYNYNKVIGSYTWEKVTEKYLTTIKNFI